jgi:hypothetical protein
MVTKVIYTFDLARACYFPAHIAFFNFIKPMIEGRLQAKTPVVSPFISFSNRTHIRRNGAVTLFLTEADVEDKDRR